MKHINENERRRDFQYPRAFGVDDPVLGLHIVFLELDREGEGICIDSVNLNRFHGCFLAECELVDKHTHEDHRC